MRLAAAICTLVVAALAGGCGEDDDCDIGTANVESAREAIAVRATRRRGTGIPAANPEAAARARPRRRGLR